MKPILLNLFGSPIYSYPLLMGIGWGVGYNLTSLYWEERRLPQKSLIILFLITFIFGWIGAKVFFLLFSTPDKILDYGKEVNFWFGGGFVFYGGFLFALLSATVFLWRSRDLKISDMAIITPGLVIGHSIGRLGCFLAGCCYGDVCDLPGLKHLFHNHRHSVQLYEAFGLILLYVILRKGIKRKVSDFKVISFYFWGYAVLRFINEFFRGDEIRGIYFSLSTSQWISVFLVILGSASWWKAVKS